ncbi:hypothetical protein AVEN_80306-1 [Araneus ventricosus]|uniref:Transposase Tc1-like domain-containing protein n=1 Tax=Araneus ventricosus TaxID=182803 RepID=A0A4Y2IIT8_ARAVE|nr:hypothetical protein AVEN_80306-1 [Araneus ventricosus]
MVQPWISHWSSLSKEGIRSRWYQMVPPCEEWTRCIRQVEMGPHLQGIKKARPIHYLGNLTWFKPNFKWLCQSVDWSNTEDALKVAKVGWIFLITTILEFVTTVIIVLRRKDSRLSVIHIFLRMQAPIVVWYGLKFAPVKQLSEDLKPVVQGLRPPVEDGYIAVVAKRNRRSSSTRVISVVAAAIGKKISATTVSRRLHINGLYAQGPRVCVPLSVQFRGARLKWCRQHELDCV